MNIQELNELDINDIASWPVFAKSILIAFVCILIGAVGYYALISDSIKKLDQTRQQEIDLKSQFEIRAAQASSLNAYRQQMVQLEDMLKSQLKQLPDKTEVAGLLDDISYIATNNGLKLLRINWEPEVKKEFYTELPMRIDIEGQYDQLGQFSADIAALPRIVLLGSFTINKETKQGNTNDIIMSVQAKTYRYDPDQKQTKTKGTVQK
ncbi:type 4a pilus biogenesis protein PilO [Tolumonas lignilytica]|jgi:Tfp pilus assembly protein PilO|uniref:type 4a pilus biogenesis protein PilO n=1 Tax=Tolumonas lignilytica TaxID=1283284 RepID=UPI00046544FB|nr:type 4a pilus biogenesis protein PilO [Tolumonas lignilytica]